MQPDRELPQREIERGPIAEVLERIPGDPADQAVRRLRYDVKAEAIVAAVEGRAQTWDGITIVRVSRRELNRVPVLEVWVEAAGLPENANPFEFVNPPVVSRDGKEDPAQAFREMVSDAVAEARKRGR